VVGHVDGGQRVYGGGIELAVPNEPITPDVAGENGGLIPLPGPASGGVVVHVAEAAGVGAELDALDVPAPPSDEVDRTPGGVVAVFRRRRTADHIDPAISVGIGQIRAAGAVRLGDREPVLEQLDVAHRKGLPLI
jgi:hypothetical protein